MDSIDFIKPGAIVLKPTKNDLLQTILNQPETQNWTKENYERNCVYHPTVPKNSQEYKEIERLFYAKTRGGLKLMKVSRVQNPFLLGEFLLKKEEMARAGPVKVRQLFHGTKKDSVEDIARDGFDWRLNGESRGVRHSCGVNFTPSAGFAENFGDRRTMILAYVLVGRTCVGREGLELPADGCDTAIKPDGNVLVKFEDGEHYPAYILKYHRFK